jgi:DNA polymerase
VTKGSDLRQKGKVAELALGYQGGVGALTTMGGEKMGLSETEMKTIVNKWRVANPAIVQMWNDLEALAKKAIRVKQPITSKYRGLIFDCDGKVFTIQLPSGRKLFYQSPRLVAGAYGDKIQYKGMEQTKKIWGWLDTYGGKLTENIIQATARDLLAESMRNLAFVGFGIDMHVHDEVVAEINDGVDSKEKLNLMCKVMGQTPTWAKDLPLRADGYLTKYYRKD